MCVAIDLYQTEGGKQRGRYVKDVKKAQRAVLYMPVFCNARSVKSVYLFPDTDVVTTM